MAKKAVFYVLERVRAKDGKPFAPRRLFLGDTWTQNRKQAHRWAAGDTDEGDPSHVVKFVEVQDE